MKNDMIENFLDKRLITSHNTRQNYRTHIKNYFQLIGEDMNTYFSNGHDMEKYENDLNKVYMVHEKKGKPYLSRRAYFSCIKQFMIANNKNLAGLDFWNILKARTKGAEPESDECILNKQDIKEILSHGNTLSRAMFLTLTSSGRRIGEILAITPNDINFTVRPTTISIKKGLVGKEITQTTKTKQRTITFISDEAKESLQAWMKERDTYLQHAMNKSNFHKKNPNDDRVFPMGYDNALYIWKKLIQREGIDNKFKGKDPKTRRDLCHPHILRKFHHSYLGDSTLADYLEGHSTMMTRAYQKKKQEDLAQDYLNLMHNVTIFENTSKTIEELRKNDKDKDELIKSMQQEMHLMKLTLQGLENRLEIEKIKNGKK